MTRGLLKKASVSFFIFLMTIAQQTFAQDPCAGVDTWSNKRWYNVGNQSVSNNHLWESINRNRNQVPPNSNWTDLGACGTSTPNNAPTTSITAPSNGSSVNEGTSITVSANASDSDGSIANVAFYSNGILIGNDASSPYSYNLGVLPAGAYNLTVIATDDDGATTTSSIVAVTVNAVVGNQSPITSITAPNNGASVDEGTNVTISANASDSDGSITNVAFYNNGTLVGNDATSPYSFNLGALPIGSYNLTVVATDNEGANTTSSIVSLTVSAVSVGGPSCAGIASWSSKKWYNAGAQCVSNNHLWESNNRHRNQSPPGSNWIDLGECTAVPNMLPTTSITAPSNGSSVNEGTSITVSADASDADGNITNVAFYNNGTLVGNDATSPYSYNLGALTIGSYNLTVVATDNDGATTTSAVVNVIVNTVPNVAPTTNITAPSNGSSVVEGTSITVSADAVDSDGSVTSVAFYNNGSLVGTDATSPYTYDLGVLALGTYSLTVVATDNDGAATTSSIVSVTVSETPPPSSGTNVIGYMPYWAGSASAIQYDKLTHINYSFAIPDVDGHLKPLENTAKLQQIVTNAHAVGGKVLIAVGGWSENGTPLDARFEAIGANATYRTNLVNDIVTLINTYNLDGADMDWEFPNAGSSANNFEALMTELYNALHPAGKLVTAAVSGSSWGGDGINANVKNVVDWLNIMAYDFNEFQHSTYNDAIGAVAYYQNKGFPNSKLALGVPFYGRNSWEAYSTIINSGGDPYADIYNGVGYNGITTIKQKTNYAIDNGLRGVMIWEISQDLTNQYSLLTAIDEEIANGGPVNQAPSASISSPTNGSSVDEGTSIVVSANAVDADGTISNVEFYSNASLVGSDASSPYSLDLGALAVGTYSLTVVATDNQGASTTSSVTSVTVNSISGNVAPTVSVTSPTAAQEFDEGITVIVTANATDSDGSITKVEFYLDGVYQGEDAVAPYDYDLLGLAVGNYSLSAVAFDNEGANTTAISVGFVVKTVSTGGGCTEPIYVEGNTVYTNDQIQNVGNLYNCTVGGWCSGVAWAYEPGVGTYWTDCWELIGSCDAQPASPQSFSVSAVNNEVTTAVSIVSEVDQVLNVKAYTSTGQLIYTGLAYGSKGLKFNHVINSSTWKQGYYIVTVEAGNNVQRVNLIK